MIFSSLFRRKRVSAEVHCCRCGVMIYIGDKVEWVRINEKNYLEHKRCG